MAEIDLELLKRGKIGLETAAQQIGVVIDALTRKAEGRPIDMGTAIFMSQAPYFAITNAVASVQDLKSALTGVMERERPILTINDQVMIPDPTAKEDQS